LLFGWADPPPCLLRLCAFAGRLPVKSWLTTAPPSRARRQAALSSAARDVRGHSYRRQLGLEESSGEPKPMISVKQKLSVSVSFGFFLSVLLLSSRTWFDYVVFACIAFCLSIVLFYIYTFDS
jgi:hypothetical protein